MNLLKLLTTAGVPEALHAQAIACLHEADKLSNGFAGYELRAPLTWSVLPGRS